MHTILQLFQKSSPLIIFNRHALSLHWSTNPHRTGPTVFPTSSPTILPLVTQLLQLFSQPSHKPTPGPLHWLLLLCEMLSPHISTAPDSSPPSHFYSNPKNGKLQPVVEPSLLPISVKFYGTQPPSLLYIMARATFAVKRC